MKHIGTIITTTKIIDESNIRWLFKFIIKNNCFLDYKIIKEKEKEKDSSILVDKYHVYFKNTLIVIYTVEYVRNSHATIINISESFINKKMKNEFLFFAKLHQ